MNVKLAYNLWASQYDSNKNRTRDLEALSLRSALAHISFKECLEIGCGTGKNTEWLLTKAEKITAVDLSDEMLARAQKKVSFERVQFVQADITEEWNFIDNTKYDLVVFSLVLEHIENLNPIFEKVSQILHSEGMVYLGELHPFKQYLGTKARFETEMGLQEVNCFTHHISDFTRATEKNGLELIKLEEHFDNPEKSTPPRILALLFRKKKP
ncbi:class I SAM-dependent methyltransferase [Antarcticibacterium sp. 1MA-6-2]|uniref:class I SAM-dependent methyltransferase n=1 Tax=Antarcticibacterium sp. 1MA-6-2 TaxID=2908210 RepID=UPI001F159059|nr:class I SAM-dependent methyltransferase [Antarcticibacterium sp. 1MA-6-2]UJH92188.1 class I SAM-dependent methyltransferase [Antarcticibacterium sp. 1MA-6-2]